jgi:hypothetical protein
MARKSMGERATGGSMTDAVRVAVSGDGDAEAGEFGNIHEHAAAPAIKNRRSSRRENEIMQASFAF